MKLQKQFKHPLIKSTFYNEITTRAKLSNFIQSDSHLSMGVFCKKFETDFSSFQDRKYSVFVNSGSSANLVLIQSLLNLGKLKPKDLVAISSLTWATNVMPLLQLGLEVVPVDCDLRTLNISIENLKKLKVKPKCLFITNVLGFSSNMEEVSTWCDSNDILLIEDNCESLGSISNNRKLGNWGIASTFSTFVGHHLSTIEGGLISTDNEELSNMLIMVMAHGWDRGLSTKTKKNIRSFYDINDFYAAYTFYDLAFNVRPTEVNAFIGVEQLKYLDQMIRLRERNYKIVSKAIKLNSSFISLQLEHMNVISAFSLPFLCKSEADAKKIRNKMIENSIEVRPIISGDITKQPFYKKYNNKDIDLPNSNFIHKCGFYIGNNPDVTQDDLEFIMGIIENI